MNELFIISGGQTGVDRAALDFALDNNIPCGGWCPKGRITEDGIIPDRYPLKETETRDYSQRTYRNVKNSDGTIVFVKDRIDKGTGNTIDFAEQLDKPLYLVHLNMNIEDQQLGIYNWFIDNNIKKINIAGAKESHCPGIYKITRKFLDALYKYFKEEEK